MTNWGNWVFLEAEHSSQASRRREVSKADQTVRHEAWWQREGKSAR